MNTINNAKAHERILEFINTLKGVSNSHLGENNDAHGILERIYRNGGCYSFAKTLQFVFPEGELYGVGWNQKDNGFGENPVIHVVFKFDNVFYDITGVFDFRLDGYKLYDKFSYDFIRELTREDILRAECYCYSYNSNGAYGKRDTNGYIIHINKEAI
jgi:hypothetical protein